MTKRKGLLVVISGFSGAGKGTLVKKLLSEHENYQLSVSATTRAPRPGEVDGKDYFFVSKSRFEEMIIKQELIEYASYVGNYYGTPKAFVKEALAAGSDVLLEIEIQGALKVRERFPEAILIFVAPPDAETLRSRLLGRGTETPEQVTARLRRAAEESQWMPDYDYLLINDDLEHAAEELHFMIDSQHSRMSQNRRFAERIRDDLNKHFLKEDL